MPTPEVSLIQSYILDAIDALVRQLDGLTEEQISWRPDLPESNSLLGLIQHVLGNADLSIPGTIAGQPVVRDRDAELAGIDASGDTVRTRWATIRPKVESTLAGLTTADLERVVAHPRRDQMTVREVLLVVATHAWLHLGEAELTRKLVAQ